MLFKFGVTGQPGTLRGAYGYEVSGLSDSYLLPAERDWPRLRIERSVEPGLSDDGSPGALDIDEARADLRITPADRVEVDRETLTMRFRTREELADQVLVHPYLSLPVAIVSFWLGRQTLHGGAFRHDNAGWALLGGREAGKSSTLGWLLGQGVEILTDDLIVLDGGTLFAGPRSVDLRGDAARLLGGEELGKLGNRDRWRLLADEAPPASPLNGIVLLEWGDEVAVEALSADERLSTLFANVALRPRPSEAAAYLELASLPAVRFTRPRGLDELDRVVPQLLDALSQAL
jgi:hypothetical protein